MPLEFQPGNTCPPDKLSRYSGRPCKKWAILDSKYPQKPRVKRLFLQEAAQNATQLALRVTPTTQTCKPSLMPGPICRQRGGVRCWPWYGAWLGSPGERADPSQQNGCSVWFTARLIPRVRGSLAQRSVSQSDTGAVLTSIILQCVACNGLQQGGP